MAESLSWNFVGDDNLSQILERLDRIAAKLDKSMSALGRQAGTMGRQLGSAERNVDQLGDRMDRASRQADRYGNSLDQVARRAGRIASLVATVQAKIGALGNTIASGGAGGPVAAALGLAAAPAIGAAAAGGVLLGTAAGVMGGGVALAARGSNQVQGTWARFGDRAGAQLTDAADPFIGPLTRAPAILEDALARSMPRIRGMFDEMSGAVEPMVRGIAGLVENALPGIEAMVRAGAPILREVAEELPDIGNAIADFGESMEAAGPGARAFFRDFLVGTEKTLVAVGNVIEVLSKVYEFGSRLPPWARGAWIQDIDAANDGLGEIPPALDDIGTAADDAASDMRRFSDELDLALGGQLDLRAATRRVEEEIDRLTESRRRNGRTLDINTEQGRANAEQIDRAIDALRQQRKANMDNGMAMEDANAIYNKQIDRLQKHLLQLGYNKQAITELIGETQKLPTEIGIGVKLNGLGAVGAALSQFSGLLSSLGTTTFSGLGRAQPRYAAAGADRVRAGEAWVVGDAGRPELFVPDVPGRIESTLPPSASGDFEYLAPMVLQVDGYGLWQGLLRFKRNSGKVSLGLA